MQKLSQACELIGENCNLFITDFVLCRSVFIIHMWTQNGYFFVSLFDFTFINPTKRYIVYCVFKAAKTFTWKRHSVEYIA